MASWFKRSGDGWSVGARHASPLLVLLLAIVQPAAAEIFVSPVTCEAVLAPGRGETGTITVRNQRPEPTLVVIEPISFADYLRQGRGATPLSWLAVAPTVVALAGYEETRVAYRVSLPDTASGEQMAMIFFSERSTGAGLVQGRIGVAFYAMAAGTLAPGIALTRIQPVIDGQGRRRLYFELANRGNVHARPAAEFEVTDSAGAARARASLAPGRPVFPGGAQRFSSSQLDADLPPGEYTVRWRVAAGIRAGAAKDQADTGSAVIRIE